MAPLDTLGDDAPRRGGVRAIGVGFLLTLTQILSACFVATYHDGSLDATPAKLLVAYTRLVQFDSNWYWCIASEGYQTEREFQPGKIGNVSFFPGYPLLVRGVHGATGLPWPICLLVVSQLACWGFWTYFLLILQ